MSRTFLCAGPTEPREATPVPAAHKGVTLRFKTRARCTWTVDVRLHRSAAPPSLVKTGLLVTSPVTCITRIAAHKVTWVS